MNKLIKSKNRFLGKENVIVLASDNESDIDEDVAFQTKINLDSNKSSQTKLSGWGRAKESIVEAQKRARKFSKSRSYSWHSDSKNNNVKNSEEEEPASEEKFPAFDDGRSDRSILTTACNLPSSVLSKVTEAARNLTSGNGVSAIMGGPQHQRLEGSAGGRGYQGGSRSPGASHEKASLLSSGSDGSYQRLDNIRKGSWTEDGWGNDWDNSDSTNYNHNTNKASSAITSPTTRNNFNANKQTSKSKDKQEQNLLLDLEQTNNNINKKSSSKVTSASGGHTWDNWDDDDWEKLEGTN